METFFLVNPVAGRGHTIKVWKQLQAFFECSGIRYEKALTRAPWHAAELAIKALERGFERLVVVGGDGTLHEAINGTGPGPGHGHLGIIPTGTGSDFPRTLGIPLSPLEAAGVLLSGQVREVDLGRVNGRFFVNVAGVGFDAEVAATVNRGLKFLRGAPAYLAAVLKVLATYRNTPVTLDLDGHRYQGKILLAAVGNARYYGGGLCIVPQAQVDDGLFHLCVAWDLDKLDTLVTLPKVFKGGHVHHPKAWFPTARQVTITSEPPLSVHADGELVGHTPATFDLVPRGLRLLVP